MHFKCLFIVVFFFPLFNQILLCKISKKTESKVRLQSDNQLNSTLSALVSSIKVNRFNLILLQKLIWVTTTVTILTFLLFFLMKKFVDLAMRNKIDLLHMKDNSARVITQHFQNQKLINSNNAKEEIEIAD